MNSLAPHSEDAEQAVLGAVFLNPLLIPDIARIIKPSDFFYLKNQWIFEAMLHLQENTDQITVAQRLTDLGKFDEVGGRYYLNQLGFGDVNSFYATAYAQTIKDASIRRATIAAASSAVQFANDASLSIEDMLSNAEKSILRVTNAERGTRGEWIASIASAVYDGVVDRLEKKTTSGIPSGFTEIDEITSGWQKQDLIILAARPAMGKTALAINMAVNAAKAGLPVAFFSLEMSKEQLVQRIIAAETGINVSAIRTGRLTEEQIPLFLEALDRVSKLPIFIDDDPSWNVISLKSECRRLVSSEGVGLIFVDYLQLLDGKRGGSDPENRVQEVSFISRHLKIIAKELKVPLIALSQLSRALESRADKHPMLSDLRESGSIEQDADVVMFIYRDDYYNDQSEQPNMAEVDFAKHRNGASGVSARLHFNKALTKFGNRRTEIFALPQYGASYTTKTETHYQ